MAMYEIHENKMWQYAQLSMNVCTFDQLAKLVHVICCTIEQCLSRQPVKDIVHTMHQFKHEHHLCIAHTLEGTCTACPVVAYSHESLLWPLRVPKLKCHIGRQTDSFRVLLRKSPTKDFLEISNVSAASYCLHQW